jgi:hypothetical protein
LLYVCSIYAFGQNNLQKPTSLNPCSHTSTLFLLFAITVLFSSSSLFPFPTLIL